jgi:hypothetical protein
MTPMVPEYWSTPLVCKNGHRYREQVEWKIHTVDPQPQPVLQMPEIRTLCRYCDASLEVEGGWTPH